MARLSPTPGSRSKTSMILAFLAIFSIFPTLVFGTDYVTWQNSAGQPIFLANDRYPALYTGDFGDCLGGQSLINVTQFDAAYYQDNMTVLFHIAGTTNLRNESIMMYITVDAYGEDRFDLIFNPCDANIKSLCPMNVTKPIFAEAIIPVGLSDVAGIPPIALVIPDFEGSASLRFYSNATQTEIACFRAVMRNGTTFSYPSVIGSVLGLFVFTAMMASFFAAIYGINIPVMRTHYAHSLSVLVVFETLQSIFFSGALSLNWPSVCAAFWSNFAWTAGMIYSPQLTGSINKFIGANLGNSSQVGGAGSVPINTNGGAQIYRRTLADVQWEAAASLRKTQELAYTLYKRSASANSTNSTGPEYSWNGNPVQPGLGLPGNWTSFGGVLSEVDVPVSDAFMTGFLWFLILLVILVASIVAFKWSLEGLSKIKWIQPDRLGFFRTNWVGFLTVIVLRTLFIGFFLMMTLTLFQFNLQGGAGVTAIAAIIFLIFFFGILGIAGYACFYRLRFGRYESAPDRLRFQGRKVMKVFPWFGAAYESSLKAGGKKVRPSSASLPLFRVRYVDENAERESVHEDQDYIKRFGWLSARFRRSKWWFFAVWVGYQFIRACFIGGAATNPQAQVFGLLLVEIFAFIGIVWLNPFEGARNTALAVYMLSISKVATVALSVAFLPRYNVDRIVTTVIGMVIIVIQGLLTIALLILIIIGAFSTWFSLTRNREAFQVHNWEDIRLKYFTHLEKVAPDRPPPPPPEMPEKPTVPYFNVNTVRRAPKIEDEDGDNIGEMAHTDGQFSMQGRQSSTRVSRSNSMKSNVSGYGSAPYGARMHRMSWSTADFAKWEESLENSPPQRSTSRTGGGAYYPSRVNTPTAVPELRTQTSAVSLRAGSPTTRSPTPTRDQQMMFSNQRFANAR